MKACFNVGQVYKPQSPDIIDRQIYNVSREYKISILPIYPNFEIDNLYPLTDHVELWNIFIIGNDKTYILANVNDPHIKIPETQDLLNNHSEDVIPMELHAVFDAIWTKTLSGRKLQFYMVWNGKLYFINTYPFLNGKNKVIGAVMFMRAFETMPEVGFTSLEGYLVPLRRSQELARGQANVAAGFTRISAKDNTNAQTPSATPDTSQPTTTTTQTKKNLSTVTEYAEHSALPHRRPVSQPSLVSNLRVAVRLPEQQ